MQTIERVKFLKQLESVSAGTASKELLEQSSCFLFNKKRIITFNDVITASIPTELKIKGVVPADELMKLLKKAKDDEIKVSQEGTKIYLRGKTFEAEFNTTDEINMPIDEVEIPDTFTKLPKNFKRLVKLACMTAGTSLSEPLLMCIHIQKDKIESCDNDRITVCTLAKKLKMNVLIPAKNIQDIIKQDIIGIAKLGGWVHFQDKGGAILSSRTVDEKYIDLTQYLPEGKGKKITFPEELKMILDRAAIFSKEETSTEKQVRVDLTSKRLILTSQNSNGKYTERKKLKYSGPDISFEINPEFLKDVLSLSNTITIVDGTLLFKDEDAVHVIKLED